MVQQRTTANPGYIDGIGRGTEYLQKVRRLAEEADRIALSDDIVERILICGWIGDNIQAINAELEEYLQACQGCFHPELCPPVEIYAAPLATDLGVDAFCNLAREPITILIDVGKIHRPDWLSVVTHEYAHAYLRAAGHQQEFLDTVTHLCLGLGLEPPLIQGMNPKQQQLWLQNWPHCQPTANPLTFWRGEA